MADYAEVKNLKASNILGKKVRRGKRANKKSNTYAFEQFLASTMEQVQIAPKKRPPRMPRIPGQELPLSTINNPGIMTVVQQDVSPREQTNAGHSKMIDRVIALPFAETMPLVVTSNPHMMIEEQILSCSTKAKKKHKKTLANNKEVVGNVIQNVSIEKTQNGHKNRHRNKAEELPNEYYDPKMAEKHKFKDYIPEELARKLLESQTGDEVEYVQGNIRINPKFFKEAYIGMPNNDADLVIDGLYDRNRALEGDLVVVKINPKNKWRGLKSPKPQKTAAVVCILEKFHPRKVVGFLKLMPDNNNRIALFSPRDHKVPRLNIDRSSWPDNFYNDAKSYANTMFLAKIVSWNDARFARGEIVSTVGEVGNLKAESTALLLENDLDVTPYDSNLIAELPASDYQPTAADIEEREDWRNQCIFSIDPMTASDLDDALSCKPLDNGNYEVGVHISDVTHYLQAFSPLDKAVALRATTIYMSDAVYHMLPKQLCNICSLLPGVDKLAFSVIYEMTPDGEVVNHRFAKTVIKSCCQFAYEHAQMMISNPDKVWSDEEVPKIKGTYQISELCTVVNNLNNLAVSMRARRLKEGSLRIDQPKLHVTVDRASGFPLSFIVEKQQDSNRLIEEFMLLANITTATHLYEKFPNFALLRHHPSPLMNILLDTQVMLEKHGVHIDIENSGALQASLLRHQPDPYSNSHEENYLATYRSMVLNILCSKAMTRARYFCTSANMDSEQLKHYALNVPLYTHFTSPIRRYSDCVVHRLLSASIQNSQSIPNWTPILCAEIAANCNKQKYNSKRAQEMSNEMYLIALLGATGPVTTTAVAFSVKDRSFDVIVSSMGINLRIYYADIEKVASVHHGKEDGVQTLTVVWKQSKAVQVINMFSVINVRVSKHPKSKTTYGQLHGELLHPELVSS